MEQKARADCEREADESFVIFETRKFEEIAPGVFCTPKAKVRELRIWFGWAGEAFRDSRPAMSGSRRGKGAYHE